jgi:uncharacterized protein
MTARFDALFQSPKPVIGMIHVEALPGTPRAKYSPAQILDKALAEADIYKTAGIDALAIENMHDRPYLRCQVGPEITAVMALVSHEVKKQSQLPCGLQILAGANQAALAVAHAANLDYIRAEGFVFAHVADEGLIQSDAAALLRYRKQIGAEGIQIFTDIKKKHSAHAITADLDLAETAHGAEFFLSDALIVTGSATGKATALQDLKAVKSSSKLPTLVGSGISFENVQDYFQDADAFIVGSHFKKDGLWHNPLDYFRVSRFMDRVKALRQSIKES